MHRLATSFVLGFHGCERAVGAKLVAGEPFVASANDYDWLGSGIYFWESNPLRGMQFAAELKGRHQQVDDPCVVGAVIDLGFCLDLLTSTAVSAVKDAYDDLNSYLSSAGQQLPNNRLGDDRLLRNLDCAVINHIHEIRARGGLSPFDSVRGVFLEGDEIYPGAGFREKTHIQICVRDPRQIKGVFHVSDEQLRNA